MTDKTKIQKIKALAKKHPALAKRFIIIPSSYSSEMIENLTKPYMLLGEIMRIINI